MSKDIRNIRQIRKFLLNSINELTTEELNKVPAGFNNNIIWNLGHMIAAQQGVCYRRAGLPMQVDDDFFNSYKPDTKPTGFVDSLEIDKIKELFVSSLDGIERDLAGSSFLYYPTWTTRYGVTLTSIQEAVRFLLFHEGFHTGAIAAIRKLVIK